jgi:aldehyde dehydrogenase (NAD+)
MDLSSAEHFIGGQFVRSHGSESAPIINPATEERVGSAKVGDQTDVERAVSAARAALPGWREAPAGERGRFLALMAQHLEARGDEMATLVTTESGAVIARSLQSNVTGPAGIYRYHASLGDSYESEAVYEAKGRRTVLRREAIGVVGVISPWNNPQGVLSIQIAPALITGCPVVIKPSPETSLDALLLAEIAAEVDLPPGVLNVVTGGGDTGAALVDHPATEKITFTGSTSTGKRIAMMCAGNLKSVTLELGGKSAAIVLDDVDLEVFRSELIMTCLPNTGQNCTAATRLLVPHSRFQECLDLVLDQIGKAPLGTPMDPASVFGPLVSARQRERVEAYIEVGKEEGGRVVLGGGRPAHLPTGYYVEPTVFVDVRRSMRVVREEIFGPVLCVIPYESEQDAIEIANDSSYGLSGSIFSADLDHAIDIARRLETGGIRINGQKGVEGISGYTYKESGAGGGREVPAYQNLKAITARI